LLVAPHLLAAFALGLLLGQVLLGGGRRNARRELGEHLRPSELLRLVDALPVGAG
jgi:hypothetical protein